MSQQQHRGSDSQPRSVHVHGPVVVLTAHVWLGVRTSAKPVCVRHVAGTVVSWTCLELSQQQKHRGGAPSGVTDGQRQDASGPQHKRAEGKHAEAGWGAADQYSQPAIAPRISELVMS